MKDGDNGTYKIKNGKTFTEFTNCTWREDKLISATKQDKLGEYTGKFLEM